MKSHVTGKSIASRNDFDAKIKRAVQNNGWDAVVADIICKLVRYGKSRGLVGMCHVYTSVLYAALAEKNIKSEMHIGQCQYMNDGPFDHSWLTINSVIVDVAICSPAPWGRQYTQGPVIAGIDIFTNKSSGIKYGVKTGLPFDDDTSMVLDMTFCEYMDDYPREKHGLWTVVNHISGTTNNVSAMRQIHANADRVIHQP